MRNDKWIIEEEGTYRGFDYFVSLNSTQGYRCGYVVLPENHPFIGRELLEIHEEVMSVNITFRGHLGNHDGYVIGWDHHHNWDAIDEEAIIEHNPEKTPDEFHEMLEFARSFGTNDYSMPATKGNVVKECNECIDELIEKKDEYIKTFGVGDNEI